MFEISRLFLWIIFSTIIVFIISKSKIVAKKMVSIFCVVICLMIVSLSAIYPTENFFFTFESPEKVFYYTNCGEIIDVINGKDSCMVVFSTRSSEIKHYIIPKTENGYKIPNFFRTKKVIHKFGQDGAFDVYNLLTTKDYYIVGTILSVSDEPIIIDSYNQPVKNIMVDLGDSKTKIVKIYSYVENFNNDYYFIVDGTKISIQ